MFNPKLHKVLLALSVVAALVPATGCKHTETKVVQLPEYKAAADISEAHEIQESDTRTLDFGFYSSDRNKQIDSIPELVEIDGKKYSFTGEVEYSVEEVVMSVCYEDDVNVKDTQEIEDTYTFVSDQTGREYTLELADCVASSLMPVTIRVSENVEYYNLPAKLALPASKDIVYFNEVKGIDETIKGSLVKCDTSEPRWVKGDPIAGMFTAENDSVYEWILGDNRITVPLDAPEPVWDGFEKDIAASLGLPAQSYRILGGKWLGDCIQSDGEIKRAAAYDTQNLVLDELGVYEGMGEAYGYKVHVSYIVPEEKASDIPKEDISKIYKIAVKAVYKQEAPETALFASYCKINEDTVGLIEIPGTVLKHPLMCSPYDEDFYLSHDIYKERNARGVPFMVSEGNLTGKQYNNIIYGHNISKNGEDVFGELDEFLDIDYARQHPYIYITDAGGTHLYRIIAAYITDMSEFAYSDVTFFLSQSVFDEYMGKVRSLSTIEVPEDLSVGDTYITLSTCFGNDGVSRTVVMACLENNEKK